MTPTTEELREAVSALWHATACRIGPRAFRRAYAADPRGCLIHCFSGPVIETYRKRHAAIVAWLQTAELPAEITHWDPTLGFNGSDVSGGSGAMGCFVIAGDEPCCDIDPDYCWDPAIGEWMDRIDDVRDGLARLGWGPGALAPFQRCAHTVAELDRLGREHPSQYLAQRER